MDLPLLQKLPRRGEQEKRGADLAEGILHSLCCLSCSLTPRASLGEINLHGKFAAVALIPPCWANLDVVPICVSQFSAKASMSPS